MSYCKPSLVRVGSYWYKHKYDIPLSDLNSFRQASTFGTLPVSLSFSSPLLFSCRLRSIPGASFLCEAPLDTSHVQRPVSFEFQALLNSSHIERSVPFQALLNTLRFERAVSFQALLDSSHVERPIPFQALLDTLHFERPVSFRLCFVARSSRI